MEVTQNHRSAPGSRPNNQPTSGGLLRLALVGLLSLGLVLASAQAEGATQNQWPVGLTFAGWPTTWTPLTALNDAASDVGTAASVLNFVGDSNNPGFYWAQQNGYLFFRMRVNYAGAVTQPSCTALPTGCTGAAPFDLAGTLWLLIQPSGVVSPVPPYGIAWDFQNPSVYIHGAELSYFYRFSPDNNQWRNLWLEDADYDQGARANPDFDSAGRPGVGATVPYSGTDFYIRTVDGVACSGCSGVVTGNTTFVDFAVSCSYLDYVTSYTAARTGYDKIVLACGQTWNVQLASSTNADNGAINYDVAGGVSNINAGPSSPTVPSTLPGQIITSPTPHTIAASAGAGGGITPSGDVTVAYGADQPFTISPLGGYHILDVLVDGVSVGAVTSYTFTNVTANHTIAASFASNAPLTITASAGTGGTIDPSGAVSVAYGSDQPFTMTPATHYHVLDVLVDGVSVGAATSYTFNNVTADHTIAASFAIDTYTIISTAGANGSIAPLDAVSVNHGSDQPFTIAANPGYRVADVLVDGVSVGAVTSYIFNNVIANHTIAASFAPLPTITASADTGGTITPSGTVSIDYGADQAFTITPAGGYHVADVLVDGVPQGAITSYTFYSVTADHTIAASFAANPATQSITASADTGGTITPSGAVSVAYGSEQSFSISASSGYHILDVRVDGVSVGAVTTYTFHNVTADHTIAASFALDTTHTITASADTGGTIDPSGGVAVNDSSNQAFTITSDPGYHVADVLVDGVSVGAVTSYTFYSVTADHTIAASFTIDTHTITATAGANGTIAPSGAVSVNHGSDQAFTITSDPGYHVADVLVDGVSVGAVTSYTFYSVTADHTIAASFAIYDPRTITALADVNGAITPSGAVSVTYGSDQAFTITPATNYHVLDVLVDGVSVGAVTSYTFTNVITNHTISARFAINDPRTITASAGANGAINPPGAVSVTFGSDQTFAITPDPSYHVADVLVDGVSVGAVTLYTFNNVTANHTISAGFAFNDTRVITASADANGAITPPGAVPVNYGTNQTFSISPAAGYRIAGVLVDGTSVGIVTSYTFHNVTSSHTISATFVRQSAAVPAFSQWGVIILAILIAASGLWVIRRRQRA